MSSTQELIFDEIQEITENSDVAVNAMSSSSKKAKDNTAQAVPVNSVPQAVPLTLPGIIPTSHRRLGSKSSRPKSASPPNDTSIPSLPNVTVLNSSVRPTSQPLPKMVDIVSALSQAVHSSKSAIPPNPVSVASSPVTSPKSSAGSEPDIAVDSPVVSRKKGVVREVLQQRKDNAEFASFAAQLCQHETARRSRSPPQAPGPKADSPRPLYVPEKFRCALVRDPDSPTGSNTFIQVYVDSADVNALMTKGELTHVAFKDEIFPVLPLLFPLVRTYKVDQLPPGATVILPEKLQPHMLKDVSSQRQDTVMADASNDATIRLGDRHIIFSNEPPVVHNVATVFNSVDASSGSASSNKSIRDFFFNMSKVLSPMSAKKATCNKFNINFDAFKMAFVESSSDNGGYSFFILFTVAFAS